MDLLTRADRAYYSGLPPLMSDAEYDRLVRITGHQTFATVDLPSLNNAIREDDLIDWIDSIPVGDRLFHVDLKIDGCSVLVRYRDGRPVEARTRKLNVPTRCLALPQRADGFTGLARGEAWSSRGRGYAAGRLRARDLGAGIRWSPFCHSAAERELWPDETLNPVSVQTADLERILELWRHWRGGEFGHLPQPSDGLVIAVADLAGRERIGMGSRAPRWALALKG